MAAGNQNDGPQQGSYDAQDITVLEGLEAVRKRPGMYIGSTGVRGLHHLVYEVVDNSVDEALAGNCSRVDVTIHPDNSVTVADDGRGIPVAMMEKEGRPALEVVLTVLHAGGKFGDGGGYKVSGGLHGVGVSVVNALSERLHVEVRRDGYAWTQDYVRGAPQAPLEQGEPTEETGTIITFLSDAEIFESLDFEFATLEQRLRETAFLTRGLRISLTDERAEGTRTEFHYEGGIEDFVRYLNENKDADPEEGHLLRGRQRRGRGRGRDAVELLLPGVDPLLRQQHQHARGRLAPVGLPLGADRHAQPLRAGEGPPAREGRRADRRRRARGPDRRHLREAPGPAVRGPDEDQARQPGHGRLRPERRQPRAGRVPRGEPAGGQRRSSRRPSRPPRPAPPPARRATSRAASPRSRTRRCRASSPTAPCATRR